MTEKLIPGAYDVEVLYAKKKESRNGNMMVMVGLGEPGADRSFAWDYIMLSGKATNMGRKKATALGVPEDMPIGEETLKGKRATVHCIVEEYNGEEQLKVDINATEWCGYEPEAQPYNEAPDAGRDEGGSAEDILFPDPPGGNPTYDPGDDTPF